MKTYKFHFVGFQLLILAYTAQSFVMLTANMEDIKKIARKFISDSLADKIAEFVAKATEQMMSDSDENDLALSDNISADNNDYKLLSVAGQGDERPPERDSPRTTRESITYKKKPPAMYIKVNDDSSKEINQKFWKEKDVISYEKSEEPPKQNKFKQEARRPHHHTHRQITSTTKEPRKKDFLGLLPSMQNDVQEQSTTNNLLERPTYEKPKRNKHSGHKLTAFSFEEPKDHPMQYLRIQNTGTEDSTFSGLRPLGPALDLTTMKEKTDFDQYDNPYYPKFVATSGPVMLPKISKQEEKDEILPVVNDAPIPGWL